MTTLDFRSDTVTLPTAEMMAAIAAAKLGDSARGDDPTVIELERICRRTDGKRGCAFPAIWRDGQSVCALAHGCQGGEVIVEEDGPHLQFGRWRAFGCGGRGRRAPFVASSG